MRLSNVVSVLALGASIVWTGGVSTRAEADAPAAPVVVRVEFTGAERTSEAYLRGLVHTTEGQPFDSAVADEDVTRLLKSGKFLSARYETTPGPEGVVVTFVLAERPVIEEIRFDGNVKFNDKKLRKEVPVSVGDPVDAYGVQEGRDAILRLYHDEGYGEATVTIDEDLLVQKAILLYRIEEGPRIRVRKILFEGNESFNARKLSGLIETKTYLWLFRDGRYDPDQVERDAADIQRFYRDEGFLDARVSYRVERSAEGTDLTITFTIVEGQRYSIEEIRFEGNTVFSDEELRAGLSMQPGQPILQREVDRDVKAIQTRYGDQGYIYAEVRAVRVFSATPGLVVVTIQIEEGQQIRVGQVVIRGNETTKDKVVRREVELFPEELFSLSKAREAERRLIQTQIFSRASVQPAGTTPGVRDVVVDVQESAKAGDFIFGIGITSNSGVLGSIMLDIKNFDLFDWPRSFTEFIKLRSFHGAGQRLRIEAQPGTELNRFRIDFTEPYFLDQPVRLGTSAYYFERGRDRYDERRVGGNVSFGKRLEWKWLKGWYGEVALRVENVDISSVDLFAARKARDVEGGNFITSVKGTVVRDRTDSRFVPTRGDRLSLAWEQVGVLGGEHFFGKLSASYAWHKTLYTDVEERKSVLTLRGRAGAIVGDAPLFERFYAGGIGSLRGFEFRGVSPRDGIKETRIGGDFELLTGAEYSFPLYADSLRGVVFTDMGTVEENFEITAWRASVGVGLRLQIDFFGPVPMEFDLAVPVSSESDDDEQIFSFFIGTVF
jgi:outer membrane protein insertion porin family